MTTSDYHQLLRNLGRAAPHVAEPRRPRASEPNRWESEYDAHLSLRQRAGEVAYYGFQRVRLRLADALTYTPDFLVVLPGGKVELHEIKGFEREDSVVKFKTAGELFPFWRFVMLTKKSGNWLITREAGAK